MLPADPPIVTESQEAISCHLSEGSSRMVDEVQEPSVDTLAIEISEPMNPSRIKVISLKHPTLIIGDVNQCNILPYQRRPKTLVTSVVKTPHTFNQAVNSHDQDSWLKSINKELSLRNFLEVWDIIDLQPDYKLVETTWVFCIKKNHLNNMVEYKACLCAQGFSQTPGVDFEKTYAPTCRLKSLWCLIAHAISKGLQFHQIDVKSAFLSSPLAKVVYLSIRVLDPCVFFYSKGSSVWLYIHINEIAIFGRDVSTFKEEIAQEFDIKDMGVLEDLGINPWKGFLHVLRYLKGAQELGLVYSQGNQDGVVGYSNTDWGNCQSTRRSVTGYLDQLCGNLILWKTWKQPSVSISTAEAEYKALCELVSELLWLWKWCIECHLLTFNSAIPIYEDNQSCINTVNGDCNLNNCIMKHVDIQLHFIKEAVNSSVVRLVYTPTASMLANFPTKSVSKKILSHSLDSLRVIRLRVRGDVENCNQDQDNQQCATSSPTDATLPLLEI
ncbi:hypothetical protein O181_090813 [Austropuccinia psidii MF-1]|uniref:Reverse transcriptase Ty1/copia-type domain-containing protein n=1 Tax=Austropuccinia psidii MF-1 TaxID=1389203 RepID=A0A9Q3IW59_9BASI|nr:hypothetical protein [Austropuccinia psidii MF-1]